MHSGQSDKSAEADPKRSRYGRIVDNYVTCNSKFELIQKKSSCVGDDDDKKLMRCFADPYYVFLNCQSSS